MEFGASIFFTDYSISPAELALALEERGFDSVRAAEHSHIPVPRKTPAPGGGELHKRYYDVMDPFVTLTAAACATKKLKIGTGIALVIQRDTIQTAKLVATIDQVSGGRFIFGIGGGWNQEEIENHGTVFATRMQKMREQIEAMKAIWTEPKPEYHGELETLTLLTRNRKFESGSLQRRVRCEPVSRVNSPSHVEKPRFSAGVRAGASDAVGRDGAARGNIGPTSGNISVGPYSSTAPPVMWAA